MSGQPLNLDEMITIHLFHLREDYSEDLRRKIESFARKYNLKADKCKLTGKYRDIENALGIKFHGEKNRVRYFGKPSLPANLKEKIISILGLSSGPEFQRIKTKEEGEEKLRGYDPPYLARYYNFPKNGGRGQKIGIIELGGGYDLGIVYKYLEKLGVPKIPYIRDCCLEGAKNNPSNLEDSQEVYLDIEIIASIAYEAEITVYFAPNTDIGFLSSILKAMTDGNNAISISWAKVEEDYYPEIILAYETIMSLAPLYGSVIFVASGDGGATNNSEYRMPSVNYPSSSPYVVSVGGSSLTCQGENAWEYSGGGFSSLFELPEYQKSIPRRHLLQSQVNGHFSEIFVHSRGIPDIVGHADPSNGYRIRTARGMKIFGGTSAVAPLYASLVALMNCSLGRNIKNILPFIYDERNKGIRPIPLGRNGGYFASHEWNPCTGRGTLDGRIFLEYLKNI